jgi:hypothetical protein
MKKNSTCLTLRPSAVALSLVVFILVWSCNLSHASERKLITVTSDDSVSLLCFKIYDRYRPEMLKHLSKINPHILNWDDLPAGEEITFLTRKEMKSAVPGDDKECIVITFLKHPVKIKEGPEAPYKEACLNMILDPQYHLDVRSGGRVELMMSEGRIMRLDGGSCLKIESLTRDRKEGSVTAKFRLFLGRVWGKLIKTQAFGKKEMYVSTPTLVAGVRGTAYDLALAQDQSTLVRVFEGEVELYNPLQKMPEAGITKEYTKPHEVSGPTRIEGPREITEQEWNQLVLKQYQQILVTKEGIGKAIAFDYEKEREGEWAKWNEERDGFISTSR